MSVFLDVDGTLVDVSRPYVIVTHRTRTTHVGRGLVGPHCSLHMRWDMLGFAEDIRVLWDVRRMYA